MTHPRQRFCARLLTLHKELSVRMVTISRSDFWLRTQSEQFRSAIVSGLGDHDLETSTSSLSFRSSELSQPI